MTEKTTETKKRTPSARVIAARWILKQLDPDAQAPTLDAGSLTLLVESRVNEAKAEVARGHIAKILKTTLGRCEKVVTKFENPAPKKAGKAPPGRKKAAPAAGQDDGRGSPL